MVNIEIDDKLERFAVIVGEGVSKGARSPLLWNRAFDGLGINAKMYPFDVNEGDDLNAILDGLFANPKFIGGAVAAPSTIIGGMRTSKVLSFTPFALAKPAEIFSTAVKS